jgi:hypothetical protein
VSHHKPAALRLAPARAYGTADYILEDHSRTLFPLNTTKLLIDHASTELSSYVNAEIAAVKPFASQGICHAAKSGLHARRTMKLDPAAEYFMYDFVFRHRKRFVPTQRPKRKSFGNGFEKGRPISSIVSFKEFQDAIDNARRSHKYEVEFDVATYFNSIYHHDLAAHIAAIGINAPDARTFGRFVRQINAGRSVDCLPQGLHPCKAIGSHFLGFVDGDRRLRCAVILRYQDDFHLFDDDLHVLRADFVKAQDLLGARSLSVNAGKTRFARTSDRLREAAVPKIEIALGERYRAVLEWSDDADYGDSQKFSPRERRALHELLTDSASSEKQVELAIGMTHDPDAQMLDAISARFLEFPGVTKAVCRCLKTVTDVDRLVAAVLTLTSHQALLTEFQVFWLARLVEDELQRSDEYEALLVGLYEHRCGGDLSKAKVLETDARGSGLGDLRREHLRTPRAWLGWASAVGLRGEPKANRNHALDYFANQGSLNAVVARCAQSLP